MAYHARSALAARKAVDPPARAEAYASLSVGIESEARPTELDVLVIGGGQAGLAIGHQLRATGLRYQILERHSRVGTAGASAMTPCSVHAAVI